VARKGKSTSRAAPALPLREPFTWQDGTLQHWLAYAKEVRRNSKVHYLVAPRPSEGEAFYLWLLLRNGHKPVGLSPRNVEAPSGCTGTFATYQEAALAWGLLEKLQYNEAYRAMQDAVAYHGTPQMLLSFFCMQLMSDMCPMAKCFDDFWPHMVLREHRHLPEHDQRHKVLDEISSRLARHGKTLADYGFGPAKTGGSSHLATFHTVSVCMHIGMYPRMRAAY
jgi:hypothetical protein